MRVIKIASIISQKSDQVTQHYSQVFFVSTLGQARNAALVIADLNLQSHALVVTLKADITPELADKIDILLSAANIAVQQVNLPNAPHRLTLGKFRRFSTIFKSTLARYKPDEIWISSANRYYAMLAGIAKARHIQVSYFEEGIGTYKPRSYILAKDLNTTKYRKTRLSKALRKYSGSTVIGGLVALIYREIRGTYTLIYELIKILDNALAHTPFARKLLAPFLAKETEQYFDIHTSYDRIRVAFPEELDPKLYQSSDIGELPVTIDEAQRSIATQWLTEPSRDVPKKIFISQNFGGTSTKFYKAVAECLPQTDHIAIKFHPKELETHRNLLLAALSDRGMQVLPLHELDALPAEVIISTECFEDVIGITSSSLFYSAKYNSTKTQYSIAEELIKKLEKMNFNPQALATLKLDYIEIARFVETTDKRA